MTMPLMPLEDDSAIGSEHENVDNATIELAAKWNGLSCEKCSAPMKSGTVSICRHCGWYGSLGQFVEVDRDWEACCGDDVKPTAPQVAPSHAQVWLNLLPRWAWIMIASSAAVVVESIVVRLATPEDSAFRTNWSLTQLVVGFIAFISAHFLNFLFAIADDADTGAIDFLLRPLKLWMKSFRNLPSRLWVANTASTGYVAAVMSIVVIGGLPYDRLWDWGFKQPPQQNLLSAVMKQAQQIEGSGDKDMEEAMKDFAGQAGADGLGANDKKPTPAKPRRKADCVILGYRVGAGGKLQSLVLGTSYQNKLVFACSVAPKFSEEESAGLLQMLADSQSSQAYISKVSDAQWVVPKFSCRVSYESQNEHGRLVNAKWVEYLGQIR
jgi:hypothetical protein